jgi:response regulator RpfG family c-di-GMP phosphodiesterase
VSDALTFERPRLLLVDDEPAVLDGFTTLLRREFLTVVATSGAEALAIVETARPFAAVLSDMHMPGMSGATFLGRMREVSPDTVRLLLTGYADTATAAAAVNDGQVFRFLLKPCSPELLRNQLRAAVAQSRLVTSERVLLEQTLRGSVQALTDLLALAAPQAFGRARRVTQHVVAVCEAEGIADRWHLEVAAMLADIGCITLPPALVEKYYLAQPLTPAEKAMVDRLPTVACQLLAPIPRLELVQDILEAKHRRFATHELVPIPYGARLLKIVLDYDILETRGNSPAAALEILCSRRGWYDPDVLDACCRYRGPARVPDAFVTLGVADLQAGMVFLDDVRSQTGLMLLARGTQASETLLARIRNYDAGVVEPLRVRRAA